jgi:hypothetical protein
MAFDKLQRPRMVIPRSERSQRVLDVPPLCWTPAFGNVAAGDGDASRLGENEKPGKMRVSL